MAMQTIHAVNELNPYAV